MLDDTFETQYILSLEALEKQAIQHAWEAFDGRSNEIADALQIGRSTLWRKLKKYQISKKE